MKIVKIGLLFILGVVTNTNAQTCPHKNLSKIFDYEVTAVRTHKMLFDSAEVTLTIRKKRNSRAHQVISFTANSLFDDVFNKCNNARSFITGFYENAEVADYDFGDIIIADLNFDGKEDIAIKYDSGGPGGPFYNFYLQDDNGRFYKSNYLTDHVGSFPQEIDSEHKTITTQIHANFRQEGRTTFGYNPKTKTWLIKHVLVSAGN
jgi:hypothetical protein